MNSKEDKSKDFCLDFFQEFGLRTARQLLTSSTSQARLNSVKCQRPFHECLWLTTAVSNSVHEAQKTLIYRFVYKKCCRSGVGTGFGSGSNIKCKKVKNLNEMSILWEIMLLLTSKKERFCTNVLFLEHCVKYCLDPEPEPDRNQNLSKVRTETATNHYGSSCIQLSGVYCIVLLSSVYLP